MTRYGQATQQNAGPAGPTATTLAFFRTETTGSFRVPATARLESETELLTGT